MKQYGKIHGNKPRGKLDLNLENVIRNVITLKIAKRELIYIVYRVRHIKCYRAIALKLLIISKNVSDKSFSVREGRHTGPPYFFYRWRR